MFRYPRYRLPPVALGLVIVLALPISSMEAQQSAGATAEPLRLTRLSGPITLDGMPDERAWRDVPPLPMTMFEPTFGGELTERTDIRIAYDDEYLYVGGRLYDSDPRGVRVNTLYRDQYSGDDLLAIVLDTYNDYETASWFVVNPSGARSDRSLANDAEFTSGFPMNPDWNTFWDAATARTEEGWFAELRIPFSSLGFQDGDGRVTMGMIVYRFIARKNERQLFPAIPPHWDLAFAKPSQAQRIVLEGVYSRRPVYATPYALGGLGRAAQLNGAGTAYQFDHDVTREIGLDLRYSPIPNLSLDVTANTDFAQVEADDQQVNLTRFSLFFPEKRQFFQERAAIFELNTGGPSRVFHSRRIGLIEGEPIRILGGVRAAGRVGGADLGLLAMQAARTDTLPSENFGVLRLKQSVLNPYSTLGGLLTTRVAGDGRYNVAAAVDAVLRPFGDEYVTLKWVQTFENGGAAPGDLDAARLLALWERRNQRGFTYAAEFIRSGAAYNPGVGFVLRDNFTSYAGTVGYQWFAGPRSPFRTLAVQLGAQTFLRNTDGTAETAIIDPGVEAELKGGAELELTFRNQYESVREAFELSGGTPVPAGDYWFRSGSFEYMASRAASLRPTFSVEAGSFFDGWRVAFEAEPAWNPSRHVELSAQYEFNAIRFPDRDVSTDIHLARLRLQFALDVHLSLATFVQYNSTVDEASVNARLRYHFREGQDLWIVYNETMNTDRSAAGVPTLPVSQNRAVLVKYTHTFVW